MLIAFSVVDHTRVPEFLESAIKIQIHGYLPIKPFMYCSLDFLYTLWYWDFCEQTIVHKNLGYKAAILSHFDDFGVLWVLGANLHRTAVCSHVTRLLGWGVCGKFLRRSVCNIFIEFDGYEGAVVGFHLFVCLHVGISVQLKKDWSEGNKSDARDGRDDLLKLDPESIVM